MQINKNLNLVIPIEREDGTVASYAYSIPISKAVFERYYMVLARTDNKIFTGGLGILEGSRVAALVLKDMATELGQWEGPEGVEQGLVKEIQRLTSVLVLTETGWGPVPLHEAIAKGFLDEEDAFEVENAIVFFTVISYMRRKKEKKAMLVIASSLWGGHLESSTYTEFCASLPMSTTPATSRHPVVQEAPGNVPVYHAPS